MGFVFNPFTGNFDISGGGEVVIRKVADGVAKYALTPTNGDLVVQQDDNYIYEWSDTAGDWIVVGGPNFITNVGVYDNVSDPNGLTIVNGELVLHSADESNPGAIDVYSQNFSGVKTFFDVIQAPNGIDVTPAGGTLSIGVTNADIINIGNASATVNFNGTVNNNNVTNLNVADQLITINKGGGAGSASGTGLEFEENNAITGYIKTSGSRNSLTIKAPNTVGIVTITPGAAGFTLDQGSHDPVTLGTSNGLSLSTQQLSLGLSGAAATGALSSTDWNAFNNKQNALTFGNLTEATSSILTISGGTGSVIGSGASIEVKQSSSTQSGYLSSTDWSTFNSKEPALTKGNLTEATSSVLTISGGTNAIIGSGLTIEVKQANTTQSGYLSSTDWNSFNAAATGYVNKSLSNINLITSVSGSLTPDKNWNAGAPVRRLGSTTNIWYSIGVYHVHDESGIVSIYPILRELTDTSGGSSLKWASRELFNSSLNKIADWSSDFSVYNGLALMGSTSGSVKINVPATISTPYTLTLPNAQGAANQVLVNNGSGTLSWGNTPKISTGDIDETSFTSNTDIVTDDVITGFAFANASVRGFRAVVSIYVDATTDLFATYDIIGVQKSGSWAINYTYVGDYTNITFSITNAGQLTYTSSTTTGFVSRKIGFRAQVIGL